jgi:hypothetical protein
VESKPEKYGMGQDSNQSKQAKGGPEEGACRGSLILGLLEREEGV